MLSLGRPTAWALGFYFQLLCFILQSSIPEKVRSGPHRQLCLLELPAARGGLDPNQGHAPFPSTLADWPQR